MKIDPLIERALEATGLPWKLEDGRGHRKIRLNGKLVGVLGANNKTAKNTAARNVVAQIRNAAKEMQP